MQHLQAAAHSQGKRLPSHQAATAAEGEKGVARGKNRETSGEGAFGLSGQAAIFQAIKLRL